MLTKFEQFGLSISNIYQDIQKIQRIEMGRYGLKGPHAQCLMALNHFPEGVTAARLCQLFEKDKAAVSRTVAELEEMKLLIRTCPGGSRYRAMLTLTEQGKMVARTISTTARLAVEQAAEGLTESERQIFSSVLTRISENLHTICKEGLRE